MAKPNVDPVALDHQIASGVMNEITAKSGSADLSQMGGADVEAIRAAMDSTEPSTDTTTPDAAATREAGSAQKQRDLGELAGKGYQIEVTEVPEAPQQVPVTQEAPKA